MKITKIQRKGNFHASRKRICDDAFYESQISDHIFLFTLADGCSGSRFGGIAAGIITKEIVLSFKELSLSDFVSAEDEDWIGLTTTQLIEECFEDSNSIKLCHLIKNIADNAVKRYMNLTGVPFYEFSTTLIFCMVDTEKKRSVCLNIGDGYASVLKENRTLSELATPKNINGDSRRTYFLTDPNAVQNMEIRYFYGDYEKLILTTDGLGKMYDEARYGELFPALSASTDNQLYLELISPYEQSLEYYSHLGDDITLLICEPIWKNKQDNNVKEKDSKKTKEGDNIERNKQEPNTTSQKLEKKHCFIRRFMRKVRRVIRNTSKHYQMYNKNGTDYSSRRGF